MSRRVSRIQRTVQTTNRIRPTIDTYHEIVVPITIIVMAIRGQERDQGGAGEVDLLADWRNLLLDLGHG